MGFFKEYWKGGEGQTEAAFHSSSFHSYFEGYIEKKQVDPATGRTKILRIYAAPYRIRCKTDAQWLALKVRTGFLYLLSVFLLILSSSVLELDDPAKYYQFFIAGGLVCDFFLLYILIHFLSAPRKMTIGNYRSIYPGLYKASFVSAAFTLAALPARIVNVFRGHNSLGPAQLLGFGCLAGSGASMLLLFFRERRADYAVEDNEHAEENGFQIQR